MSDGGYFFDIYIYSLLFSVNYLGNKTIWEIKPFGKYAHTFLQNLPPENECIF
jgi:hypothetical protein